MTARLASSRALLAIALASAAGFAPGAARAQEILRRGGTTVEFGTGDAARAAIVPAVIDGARRDVARDLGLTAGDAVTVRLLRAGEAFSRPVRGKPVELFAGLAFPHTGVILVNAESLDREGAATALARTVRHEFVHLALGHSLGDCPLPQWFEEGLACAFGSPLPREHLRLAAGGRGFALGELERFPGDEAGLRLAYAQAESVVRFLTRRAPRGALTAMLSALRTGLPFERALEEATGFGVETLDAAWRDERRPWWIERVLWSVFGPDRILLWTALFVVVGYFFVRRRRLRAAERLDDVP